MRKGLGETGTFFLMLILSSGFIVAFMGATIHLECSQPDEVTPVKSASMSGQTQGMFGIFGGTINEEQHYFFYVKKDDGIILEESLADRTIIVETDGEPRIKRVHCDDNKLYVPKDTVILDYHVSQPANGNYGGD